MPKHRTSSLSKASVVSACIAFISIAHAAPPGADSGAGHSRSAPAQQKSSARQASEERLWQIAVDADKAGVYDAYLRKYPDGRYAALARARLAAMGASQDKVAPEPPPLGQALPSEDEEPARSGRGDRRVALSAEDELWSAASSSGSPTDFQAYLREYPRGRYAAIARQQLAPEGALPEPVGIPAPRAQRAIRVGDQIMVGDFVSDPRTGEVSGTGRIDWASGNRFEGTLVKGIKQGKGRFSWPSGQRYIGDWANDMPNGTGTIYFANGDRYDGEVKDGQANGQGIAHLRGGDTYAGNWVNGKRHGTGRYSWVQGGYWEGEFRDGERTDQGVMVATPSIAPPATRSASNAGLIQ